MDRLAGDEEVAGKHSRAWRGGKSSRRPEKRGLMPSLRHEETALRGFQEY
jgi:hypothetical protein